MYTQELNRVCRFLRVRPGYLDWGNKRLADRVDCSHEVAGEAKKKIKAELREEAEKDSEVTTYSTKQNYREKAEKLGVEDQYQKFLEEHGIEEGDVVQVYYKQKASGVYFTVQTRHDTIEDFDPEEAFREAISEYSPPSYTKSLNSPDSPTSRLAILNLFDAHLDKVSFVDTSNENRSVEDNVRTFDKAFDELLDDVANKNPEKIVIPLGNDFWHTNDDSGSTKGGTYLGESVGLRNMDSFRLGINLIRKCIDKARQIAPVELLAIRGNHDNDKVLYMLECLLIAYEHQEDVTVHDSRKTRQYIRYGDWLFGFAHGDNQRKASDLPSLMSTDEESREHWSDVDRGIYFLGDIHHERRYDYRGCTVMYLRSSNPTVDEWHWENGYTAIPKTAYAFVYDKDGTREREFKVNV